MGTMANESLRLMNVAYIRTMRLVCGPDLHNRRLAPMETTVTM